MNNAKGTARPVREVILVKDDGSEHRIAVIYFWNTGEEQIRWCVARDSLRPLMRIRCIAPAAAQALYPLKS